MQSLDHSLERDLQTLLATNASRRQSLPLAGCGGGDAVATTPSTSSRSGGSASAACSATPKETGGPYPGDGTNRNAGGVANALVLSGIVRSDIRVHFEVYPTLGKASNGASVANLARISYATDNVFGDGTALQMAGVTGNPTQGYVATLTVGVSL